MAIIDPLWGEVLGLLASAGAAATTAADIWKRRKEANLKKKQAKIDDLKKKLAAKKAELAALQAEHDKFNKKD